MTEVVFLIECCSLIKLYGSSVVTHNSKISARVLAKIHYKPLYDLKFNYNLGEKLQF